MTRNPLLLLLPLPLVALGACGPSGERAPAPAANTAAESGYIARVEALPEGQVRGVLFRAIRDGGSVCPQLTSFERAGSDQGRPVWNATCSDQGRWRIVLSDDGTAAVTGASPSQAGAQ